MIDSLGSSVLQSIDVSSLLSTPCYYCANQGIYVEAYLILSKLEKISKLVDHSRVMCENGHIFSISNNTIRNRKEK